MMRRSRSYRLAAISLLVLAGFLVRALSLNTQSLWRDEVDALHFATAPWSELLSNFTRSGWNGPFYYSLLSGWIALSGTSEYAMRFLSLLFGVLCIPLIYALGRRLFSRAVGFVAALLVTFSPYLTWYSQEVRMYTFVPMLALLIIYSLRRAVEGGGWHWWAIQVAATTLAFYSHILAALLIPVQVLIYFAWWSHSYGRWKSALISLACLTLPYLPLLAWQAPLAFQARETGFHHHALVELATILLKGWSMGIAGWGWSWDVGLIGLLALWGLVSPLASCFAPSPPTWERDTELGDLLALVGWLTLPPLAVWLISLWQPLFTDRYLIWTAPAFYLCVALGLVSIARLTSWGHWIAACLTTFILVFNGVNLWQQATTPIKSDFRAAAAYVADYSPPVEAGTAPSQVGSEKEHNVECYLPLVIANRRAFDALIIFQMPYARRTFDYYFPIDQYPQAEGLYTNHAVDGTYLMSRQEAARRMRKMTEGYNTIWLVATEVSMWDERGLVQAWLEEHAERVAEAHFTRVDVYRYVR